MQPVKVDESVFERNDALKKQRKFFKNVNTEATLTPDQIKKIMELLQKHKDIFAKDDADIGN